MTNGRAIACRTFLSKRLPFLLILSCPWNLPPCLVLRLRPAYRTCFRQCTKSVSHPVSASNLPGFIRNHFGRRRWNQRIVLSQLFQNGKHLRGYIFLSFKYVEIDVQSFIKILFQDLNISKKHFVQDRTGGIPTVSSKFWT